MHTLIGRSSVPALALVCLALLFAPTRWANAKKYPEPSIYPISWELNFKHGSPQRIVVDLPGTSAPGAYWYMTYTVTNKTGNDQTFYPTFELVTADGKRYRGDFAIRGEVFDAIKKHENNPLLEPAERIGGTLRQGDDQAKDGVVIWKEPASSMREFSIFVGGLSGEHVTLKDDDGKPIADSEGQPVILRKTLELMYQARGGAGPAIDPSQIQEKPQRWVMR
jgi:hypothetical protein